MGKSSLPNWDLGDLYKSINDPRIEKDITQFNAMAENYVKKHRGKITNLAKAPNKLLLAIKDYENILQGAAKPIEYASLVFAENSIDPKNGAFLQKVKASYLSISQQLIFFDLGLTHLEEKTLKSLIENPILKNYHHFLGRLLDYKIHRLTEPEEKIISDKSLTGRSAFIRLFDQETAKRQYKFKNKQSLRLRRKSLTQSELLDLFYSSDREIRKTAAETLTLGLNEELERSTFITNILIEDKAINDKYMKYVYPEESRHLDNEITKEVVETMIGIVVKNYKVVQGFYNLKKRVLGLKRLEVFDVYAPVAKPKQKYSYKQAQSLVLESFSQFSIEYAKLAKDFFDKNWIDVPPMAGKRSGAFCSFGLPGQHPYVFLNYTDSIRNVLVLAHELGHGVHARLFGKQTYLNFDTALTIAEISSVFAEMIVFDYLKNKITDKKELFALYMSKIEDIFATVFRQVGMYRFEQELHNTRREKGELTKEKIGEIWHKTRVEMFANSVNINQKFDSWWSYIPHFIHTPFYVYAYAFGELLTLSLYMQYKKDPKKFTPLYLNFLRAGGSKSPQELLEPLGINLEDPEFWQEGINFIKNLIEEAKRLKLNQLTDVSTYSTSEVE